MAKKTKKGGTTDRTERTVWISNQHYNAIQRIKMARKQTFKVVVGEALEQFIEKQDGVTR